MKPTCGGIDPPTPLAALLVTAATTAAQAWSGDPASHHLWAILAAIGTWWLIWALPAPAAAAAVLVALLPIPAVGLAGLRVLDAPLWIGVALVWSGLYAVTGALCAGLVRRLAPRLSPPLAWLYAWSGLDQWSVHNPPASWWLPLAYGYPFVDTPLVGAAALFGPLGIGAAAGLLGLTGAAWLRFAASGTRCAQRTAYGLTIATASLAASLALLSHAAERAPLHEARRVAVTQVREPTLPEGERWLRFLAIASGLEADWHIWPEAALPPAVVSDLPTFAAIVEELANPLLAGALRTGPDGEWVNSAIYVDHHTVRWVYDKERLVPHFEVDLQPGGGERWPLIWEGWRIGILICWESLYFDLALQRVRDGAEVLVILAHAGWAGESVSGAWHARIARVLAWSLGIPVIFASHEGPSRAWSHAGRLLFALGPGSGGVVEALAPAHSWRTPYRLLGVGGVTFLWAMVGALVLVFGRARQSQGADRVR